MSGAGKKWAVGCGIGCGMMLLIFGGIGTCGYLGVKKFTEQAEGLEETFAEVEERFGDPADFVPSPDGTVAANRMETFLTIRADMIPVRTEMSEMLSTLDGEGSWLAKAQAGVKLVPALLSYVGERNQVLLSHDMGVGEYQYIYALSYYVMLDKDPADGPGFILSGDDDPDDETVHVNWGSDSRADDVREGRVARVRAFVNVLQVQIMENQLDAYRASLPSGTDLATDPWGAQLMTEVETMKRETLRFPWEEGLPAQLRASLEPYRDQLEQSYDEMTSVIEMGLTDED